MKITSMEEYGLRCMLWLAAAHEARPGSPCAAARIAGGEGLSEEYAAKLLHELGRAGLVCSVRGPGGGYLLARPAGKISLAEVLAVFSDGLFGRGFCTARSGRHDACVHRERCALRPLWSRLETTVAAVLESLTLADLLRGEPALEAELRGDVHTAVDAERRSTGAR